MPPKKPTVEIRTLELEDLAPVFALGERLFTADQYPNLYRTWDEYELTQFFGADEETCLVAESEGQIVGFLLGTLIDKRRSSWRYGWVVWLGVDPAFGRRGLARRMLDKVTERFVELGARMLMADTAAENEGALRFFERAGFGNREEHVYLTRNLSKDPKYGGPAARARNVTPKRR